MKVFKFDSDSGSYERQAVIHDDGTVTGDSPFASRCEEIFKELVDLGLSRSDAAPYMKDVAAYKYNTGVYVTVRE